MAQRFYEVWFCFMCRRNWTNYHALSPFKTALFGSNGDKCPNCHSTGENVRFIRRYSRE